MNINAAEIPEYIVRIQPDFKPITNMAIEWKQSANGNFYQTDRGASADTYSSQLSLYGVDSIGDFEGTILLDGNHFIGATNLLVNGFTASSGTIYAGTSFEIAGYTTRYHIRLDATITSNAAVLQITPPLIQTTSDNTAIKWVLGVDDFIVAVQANRTTLNNVMSLSNFSSTEYIFGANVDHAGTISATVFKIGTKKQNTWKGFSLPVMFRAVSPTFVGTTGTLPLKNVQIGYEGDSDVRVKKLDSYDNTFTYLDRVDDSGRFEAVLQLNNTDMQLLRNIVRVDRGAQISVSSISGVASMFGGRRGGYPHNVRMIEMEDLGMSTPNWWRAKVVLTEDHAEV